MSKSFDRNAIPPSRMDGHGLLRARIFRSIQRREASRCALSGVASREETRCVSTISAARREIQLGGGTSSFTLSFRPCRNRTPFSPTHSLD